MSPVSLRSLCGGTLANSEDTWGVWGIHGGIDRRFPLGERRCGVGHVDGWIDHASIAVMLTHAPLPRWWDLFRALVRRPPSDAELAAPWRREGEVAGWLSRSAWSLALIALWRQHEARGSTVTAWFPDFFCNSSLAPLRLTGAKLVFYPVTEGMTPDYAACRNIAETHPPDLFVLLHYIGRPAPAAASRDFCVRHRAWLIEDAAHVLRPIDGVGRFGDFVVYSPHKHLAIPDGAVLVVRQGGAGRFDDGDVAALGAPHTWPGQLRELHRKLGQT